MPKKVITRRQRKAAEAKRKGHQEKSTCETKPAEPEPVTGESLDAQQSTIPPTTSGARSEPALVPKKTQAEEGAATATAEAEMEKTKVRIIVNEKNVTSDKMLDLFVDEPKKKKPKNTIKRPTSILGGLPPTTSAGSQIEQGSISKSITQRAAATMNKIQKFSKAFNKKINPSIKQSSSATSQVAEPMNPSGETPKEEASNKAPDIEASPANDNNTQCDCEFCKVVLNQLLARQKKTCKNCRRLANHLEAGHSETGCEECTVQEPFGHEARFLQIMELNQREIERSVRKRIKELRKIKANKKLKANKRETETQPPPPPPPSKPPSKPIRPQTKPKPNIKETIATDKSRKTQYTCSAQPNSLKLTIKSNRKKNAESSSPKLEVQGTAAPVESPPAEVAQAEVAPAEVTPTKVAPAEVAPAEVAPAEVAPVEVAPAEVAPAEGAPAEGAPAEVALAPLLSAPKEVTNKETFFNVMKQMAFASPEVAPIKVLGVTGYFVLTGTNDQLNAQLGYLQEKNVFVQQCMELMPGVADKAEEKLEALMKNREQILKQMAEVHSTVEPRRQKRLKKQRKFPKL